jgi:phenylalanyl-tRNA synthetase beta chain
LHKFFSMNISYKWLKELIDITESPEEIGKILTSTGLEVEAIEEVESIKGGLKGVVIGTVLTCEKHPEADRLHLTTVSVGTDTTLSIVCGAPNVAAGQKVLVATLGTTLYPVGSDQPLTMKKAKIRGALSEGMICAEDELGIGISHAGIMVLETELPDGTPAAEFLGITSDYVFEIGLTPNRADAASHFGVARDLKAHFGRPVQLPDVDNFKVDNQNAPVNVTVENNEACPRYAGLTISGITVKESPAWLKTRLEAIGVRCINNVVDITNYVCHTLGQPMHAFDLAKVKGNQIIVKTLPEGTPFFTLDGQERKLKATDLMICNAEEPMCIAGVFGGADSGVNEATTAIFLESAYFDAGWIRKASQNHSLKTDSSFRFERGTDPEMPLYALKYAAMLLKEIAGGQISSEITEVYPAPISPFVVNMKYKNIDRLIGKTLDHVRIHSILNHLDIKTTDITDAGFKAIVPAYRVDVQREADVIEEILRIYGFDNIELSKGLSSDYLSDFPVNDPDKLKLRISEALVANGFLEILNNSLTKAQPQQQIKESLYGNAVTILNYLSEDLSVMRQTLLFSGLETLAYNINRRQKNLKMFEFGKSYHELDGKYTEKNRLAVYLTGNFTEETWFSKARGIEFHDLAGFVQQILSLLRVGKIDSHEADSNIFSYGITYLLNSKPLVSFGKVQPSLTQSADIKGEVFYADFDWDLLLRQYKSSLDYNEVARFPEVRRDLSIVLEKNVSFEQIKQLAYKTERKLLKNINVFDIFEGKVLEGKKSYSVSFTLLDDTHTLTDKSIDKTMQRLIDAFEKELGAVIRR